MISAAHRAQLAAIADELIPAGSDMPSASGADVHGRFLDEVLAARPDLAVPLQAALEDVAGLAPGAAIAALRDTDGWGVITVVVPSAYFLNPATREALGYPGLERRPIDPDAAPDYDDDGLLASVIARGPVYRATPTD
jgi:hypothetical protein